MPYVSIEIGDQLLFDDQLSGEKTFFFRQDLSEEIDIKITLKEKVYTLEYETAAIIEEISVDKINIIPRFLDRSCYSHDHGPDICSNYLGYNGQWNLVIQPNFYNWYHQATAQGWLLTPTK